MDNKTRSLLKETMTPEKTIIQLQAKAPVLPILHGLPKVNKEGVLLHPIVSNIGALMYTTAKYLKNLLSPHVLTTFVIQSTSYNASNNYVSMIQISWLVLMWYHCSPGFHFKTH